MKKFNLFLILMTLMFAFTTVASAQAPTASGTLTVTATVSGSISLVFNNDANGLALSTGAGTNVATLAFGNVSAFGPVAANVTRTAGANNFTVSTPVDVRVDKFNSASANYILTAQLGTVDGVNTWAVGGNTVSTTTIPTLTATGTYGANTAETVAITIPFTTASGTLISNSIIFTAQAN